MILGNAKIYFHTPFIRSSTLHQYNLTIQFDTYIRYGSYGAGLKLAGTTRTIDIRILGFGVSVIVG